MKKEHTNYYVKHQTKMMKDFDVFSKSVSVALADVFQTNEIVKITAESRTYFENLLPEIPYIGGFKNSGTRNITGSALFLSVIITLENRGMTEREIGKVIHDTFAAMFKERPRYIQKLVRFLMTKPWVLNLMKKRVEGNMQYEVYPHAWKTRLTEFIDDAYAFGIDIKQCGICKFFKEKGKSEYIKYMCLGDYPMFKSFGLKMTRTSTANVGDICDFRFSIAEDYNEAWPPENLVEWKNDYDLGRK